MKRCRGCGAVLQTEDRTLPGYTPKAENDYCQRCFRLIHYDDLTVSMRTGIDPDLVLEEIRRLDALVLWVVDLFDFEAGMIPGLSRRLDNKDIILVCAKRDILPDTLNHEKIARFVFGRLREMGIQVKGLVLTSKLQSEGIEEVRNAVRMSYAGRPVVVMGRANSGKSTLLNHLLGEEVLTSSRYPGTTLEFNHMEIDGIDYIDTPGIEIGDSLLMEVREEDLKTILPARMIKPQGYQVNKDQSFAIGGLARIDLTECDHASCVFYLSDKLSIHRSKLQGADALWEKHYGELFTPVPLQNEFHTTTIRKNMDKMDIVIEGLGWASVSGQISTITVKAPKGVNITFRKAML